MFFKTSILIFAASQLASLAFGSPIDSSPVENSSPLHARAPSSFQHPGVVFDKAQLDFVKSKVNGGQQPWTDAYNNMLSSQYASTTRTPKPRATVECGPTSTPDFGCTDERQDAIAAYTLSLAWYISGTAKYAQKAIDIMNAWAGTIKAHTNSNAPLQTGWAGSSWAKAAEIIRYSNAGWSQSDITKFENMLRNVYLPELIVGSSSNGNWELGKPPIITSSSLGLSNVDIQAMMEAAIGTAVFLNDGSSYDKAVSKFTTRVPGYIYLLSDGPYPKAAPGSGTSESSIKHYWQDQPTYQDNGIAQETCRDFVHTGYGLSSISHVLETMRIQGNDQYGSDLGTRLRYGLGFHSKYQLGAAKPDWLCPGKDLKPGLGPSE